MERKSGLTMVNFLLNFLLNFFLTYFLSLFGYLLLSATFQPLFYPILYKWKTFRYQTSTIIFSIMIYIYEAGLKSNTNLSTPQSIMEFWRLGFKPFSRLKSSQSCPLMDKMLDQSIILIKTLSVGGRPNANNFLLINMLTHFNIWEPYLVYFFLLWLINISKIV